jgi:hypothetical protein
VLCKKDLLVTVSLKIAVITGTYESVLCKHLEAGYFQSEALAFSESAEACPEQGQVIVAYISCHAHDSLAASSVTGVRADTGAFRKIQHQPDVINTLAM